MRNGQEEEEEGEEEEEANPTTSSAVIFSWRRCKPATTAATTSECVLPKWSMYSGKKPVEWLDLSRQLFLARHAACVAVKSAFLRDHLNAAAAAGCQVCNRPIRQSAYYQLPITSSVYCQLAPLLAACCHLPLATAHQLLLPCLVRWFAAGSLSPHSALLANLPFAWPAALILC